MTRIVLDSDCLAKLNHLAEPLEVCDESGRVLGRFTPALDPLRYRLEPQIDEAEVDRRRREPGRLYSTAEVFAHLEQL